MLLILSMLLFPAAGILAVSRLLFGLVDSADIIEDDECPLLLQTKLADDRDIIKPKITERI